MILTELKYKFVGCESEVRQRVSSYSRPLNITFHECLPDERKLDVRHVSDFLSGGCLQFYFLFLGERMYLELNFYVEGDFWGITADKLKRLSNASRVGKHDTTSPLIWFSHE